MLRLALPVVAEQLLHMMVMLVDVWLVGHYINTAPSLAAIGLIAYTMWFLNSVSDFVSVGATAMTARFVGAGDVENARHVTNQALVLAVLLAIGVTSIAYFLLGPYVTAMGMKDEAADLAVRYLWIVLPVMPAVMIQRVGTACLRGAGDMVSVFWVMAAVNGVNVLVSCALVIGFGPLEPLGWDGVAIGTATAYLTGGVIVLAMLLKGRVGLKLRRHLLKPSLDLLKRLMKIGLPGGADTMFVIACHLIYLRIINDLGDDAAAAHNVGIRLESMAFLPGAGFAMAAATLAGQFLGAGDHKRAGRSVLLACLTGCGVMLLVGLLFFFAGEPLARIFVHADQQHIAETTATLLKVAAFAMLPLGLQMILSGALRGAGDTRWPLVFTVIGFVVVRIPAAYLLAHSGWFEQPIVGAWYAMLFDLTVRCLLVVYRFRHGGWKRIRV